MTILRGAGAVVTVVVLMLGMGMGGCAAEPVGGGSAERGWVELDELPFESRDSSVLVWTGEEVVVVGGASGPPCPPNADCMVGPLERGGAALDPDTGSWREIAPAPHPIALDRGVFADGKVFVQADSAEAPGILMSYSLADDVWEQIAVPGDGVPRTMVADGGDVLFVVGSHEFGAGSDLVLDSRTGEWDELPSDPLGTAFDRYMTPTPEGILLTAKELVDSPGSEEPSLVEVALFDRDAGTWERLPDAEQIGGWDWRWTGVRVVDVALGGGDGGEINGWGREYPFGGMLELPGGEWSPLPDPPAWPGEGWLERAVGGDRFLVGSGHVFDDIEETWTPIAKPAGAPDVAGQAIWAGHRLIVIGGTDWSGWDGTRSSQVWMVSAGSASG